METLPFDARRKIKSTADYFREEGWKECLKEIIEKTPGIWSGKGIPIQIFAMYWK